MTIPTGFQYRPERCNIHWQDGRELALLAIHFQPLLNFLMLFSLFISIQTSTIPIHKNPIYYLKQFQTEQL